ncbi:methyltransferase domain-containing protein [uncultured Bacteroides sp.]|uniref:class I SAM-dependent methyltransferase n=1 Tax=uncultured Bacteroides sp. TaxID=162156 RepID=UPI002AA7D107|nr:methyltransferase domain-containing protein [uncultured Bacteroides sp.]
MESVKEQFDEISKKYDSQRRILIPCYDDFYGIATEWLHLNSPTPKILDLGAGTGLFSQFVLEKYPQADITLLDFSEQMLTVARERFANLKNVSFQIADMTTFQPQGKYDAVISSLAIHHLSDKDKQELFRKIHGLLNEGGVFVNAEQVKGSTDYIHSFYTQRRHHRLDHSELSKEAVGASYERNKLDKCASVSEQMEWLRQAGFKEVDCPFKYYIFAVLWGMK